MKEQPLKNKLIFWENTYRTENLNLALDSFSETAMKLNWDQAEAFASQIWCFRSDLNVPNWHVSHRKWEISSMYEHFICLSHLFAKQKILNQDPKVYKYQVSKCLFSKYKWILMKHSWELLIYERTTFEK